MITFKCLQTECLFGHSVFNLKTTPIFCRGCFGYEVASQSLVILLSTSICVRFSSRNSRTQGIEQNFAETFALEVPILPLVPIPTIISTALGWSIPCLHPSRKHIIQNLHGLMLAFTSRV